MSSSQTLSKYKEMFVSENYDRMVMDVDVYQSIVPKPFGCTYILEKFIIDDKYEPVVLLGDFDELETALHALDLTSKYRSAEMKKEDFLCITRIMKNTLVMKRTVMARWECTGERGKNLISQGRLELCSGLRTHDVEH